MRTNPHSDAARLLLLLFCCVVTCRVTCGQKSNDKKSIEGQKEREKIFLCGASDLYVRWNVTFGALQKRAENVSATAKKMRDNRQLYVNETEAESVASDAISKIAHVLSNTSKALNVNRGFMDGIERDFFNAFEAIKDNPDKYVYGHSNLNDEMVSKRTSEVLAFFKNISKLYTECKNKSGLNVTVESLEREVMVKVDNVTDDLSTWKDKQVAEWEGAKKNVSVWLENMKNHTEKSGSSKSKNIWEYDVTIWSIIEKDCRRVHKVDHSNSSVGATIVNSSRLNLLRHLNDIANNATTESSIMENGCESMYNLFRDYVSIINRTEAEKKKLVIDLCIKIEKEPQTMKNCTANRTSLKWIKHRFNETVHEMVGRMHNSLTQLIAVEKKVLTKVGNLIVNKRDAICNDSKRFNSMNVTLRDVYNKRYSAASSIHALNASIVKGQLEAEKALGSSKAAVERISMIESIADGSPTQINEARDGYAEVERTVHQVLEIKAEAEKLLNGANGKHEKVDGEKRDLESALGTEESHLKINGDKIIKALRLLKGNVAEFDSVEKLCSASFKAPSVPIDVATNIMSELSNVNSSTTLAATEEKAKDYEKHIEELKALYTKLDEYKRTINGNATEAAKSAAKTEEMSKTAEDAAATTASDQIKEKGKMLCAADSGLAALSSKIKEAVKQQEDLSLKLSVASTQSAKAMYNATEAEKSCQISSKVVEGAKRYVHAVDDVGLMHATNVSCMSSIASVIRKSKEAVDTIASVNKTMQTAENAQKNANDLFNEENTRLEAAKSNFTEMLKSISVVSSEPVNVCDTNNFKSKSPTLESLTMAVTLLRSINTINVENVNKSVEQYGALIANAKAGADIATVRSREAKGSAENSTKFATEADEVARSVLKQALAKQKERLCNAAAKLKEVNRNTAALRDHANSMKTDATEHLRRAAAAGRSAEDAVAHAVAAEVHAGKVVEEYQLTTEAVKKTKAEIRHAMKSAAVLLRENEEHLNKINSSFEGALKNVSNGTCNIVVNVCSTATDNCTIVAELEESLRTIEGIDALMNVTAAINGLARLMMNDALIESQLKAADAHASAAEAAAVEAHAAAKNAQCTPLYMQLLHALGNFRSV
ncbi:hypothetical protein ERJ75_000849900 [Trypanosoma vivax]|uniref:Uncharacterized protein n=1 Tax=Trypanosoma vivax (strain Y486) TaxID=1055687 RepID=F9WLS6_TRYVY|nr:hypothetical protein ERJ75_000849900 [Trypanosoma vivax]CCD18470.1 hypothetical protein, conserved in T. vivax [Trypanosoma vivax Y486]|eukprot:CCD18470.1 hypothetical protein, conserved in T. vivax [Trypanosoma vivax Y486]